MFDTTPYEEKMNHVLEHLEERLGKIRTGRGSRQYAGWHYGRGVWHQYAAQPSG